MGIVFLVPAKVAGWVEDGPAYLFEKLIARVFFFFVRLLMLIQTILKQFSCHIVREVKNEQNESYMLLETVKPLFLLILVL